jgi:hypothetical protein
MLDPGALCALYGNLQSGQEVQSAMGPDPLHIVGTRGCLGAGRCSGQRYRRTYIGHLVAELRLQKFARIPINFEIRTIPNLHVAAC